MIELNWVVLIWSCWDIDEVPGTSSNRSPPSCFEIDSRYVSFSSVVNLVRREGPAFSSCKARHGELGLNVTLPLNVSPDLGLGTVRDTT